MNVELDKLYGVISGDIVRSTKIAPVEREQLFFVMKEGSDALQKWLGKHTMPLEVDVYSGDSWQILLTNPGKTLAAGLFYRAYLRASAPRLDTRLAAGIGPIDFVPGKKVSEGDGEAFRLSGQLLAKELGKRRMGFVVHEHQPTHRWDVAFDLIDAIVSIQWREKQARSVMGALRGWTQEEIGAHWKPPLTQASVNRHLRLAGWPAISRTVAQFEEYWAAYDKNSASAL
jgi:hypothetical protein